MDLEHADLIRLAAFVGVLATTALAERLFPRRRLAAAAPARWASNLGLVCLNNLLARLVVPVGAVGLALLAEKRGWGILNNSALPGWLAVLIAVIALDLAIYVQHVLFHAVPLLWRLHLVHHADLDVDVTTGLRFHTLEILLSLAIKLAAVVLLGPPALAVLIFESLLNATSMFSHSNVRLPAWLDRGLRLILVTPDMHRVHHSARVAETNSNFGFNLPWWDYLLGTYRAQPADSHETMMLGLTRLRDEQQVDRLPGMLALPFTAPLGDGVESVAAGRALSDVR